MGFLCGLRARTDARDATMTPPLENSWLRQWTGPFTEELVRTPGKFGLGQVPARYEPDSTTTMVCGFCSTGCGLTVHLKEGKALNLSADPRYPVNLGMACPKGWEALSPLESGQRLTAPLLREGRGGAFRAVDWKQAMEVFVSRMKAVQGRHGPHSIAFLSTGQMCTEEMALLGSVFKFGMGGLHCDSNTRQCMATSHVAYKQSFGFDAPPFTYADFETSEVLVFIGANPCIAHPIMWQRVMRNPNRPKIIVVDPRRTETAISASLHVPIAPKSDLVFLYGVARALLHRGAVDLAFLDAHATGYGEFFQFLDPFTPERVCQEARIERGVFEDVVESIASRRRVSFWWTMGVNQSHEATRTAQAIINLALMTGNIGRPGTGANSITGQCNAMGSRLFANATSLLGGRDFARAEHRAEVAETLGIPEGLIPTQGSWAYDQILDGIESGAIRGLWIIATNTAASWIHQSRFQELAAKLEFLVVQDLYDSVDTVRSADLVLPAAGWGEKEGTLINSERRIGLVKRVRPAPGLALADFSIFRLVAESWGCGELFRRWSSPEAVFQLLKKLSSGRPFDITGIRDYAHLDACGGIQWPCSANAIEAGLDPASASGRERRLFESGHFFTPDGKARFLFDPPRPVEEPTDAEYPMVLLTGRGTSAQWHTNTRTGQSAVLRKLYPAACYVELNAEDALRLGVDSGQTVRVISRRGELRATAFLTSTVGAGQVFVPMHYVEVNRLTFPSFDPHSRQPSYKHCAVRVESISDL